MGKIIRNGIVYAGSPNVEVIDAYTKTESNSRFASKSIYGDSAIQLDNNSYSVSVGYNNRDSNLFSGNVMLGSDNWMFGAIYNNTIIGNNNEISKSVTSGDKNIVIGNDIDYQGEYGVAIGYDDKYMEVCPNGDVIVRGDVQCSDGSGGTVSLRGILNDIENKYFDTQTISGVNLNTLNKTTGYIYCNSCINAPSSTNGMIHVAKSGVILMQEFINYGSSTRKCRWSADSGVNWSSWA